MTASADHPAIRPEQTGRTYWQSFEHLAESPEVAESLEKEFADYTPDDITAAPTRRKFLKYAAAGMSLAGIGLSGCRRWPTEVIAPYAHAVNDHIPGVPEYYASSWEVDGVGAGLIVESFDGRPIKVEGNALHPSNLSRNRNSGACDTTAVAQTLSLYDPERARGYVDRRGQAPVTLPADAFEGAILPQLREALATGRLAVLTQSTASPTYTRLLAELPEGAHYAWAPLATDHVAKATALAFGRPLRAVYELDEAMIVVGFDDDYIGQHPAHVKHEAAWARLRVSADDEAKPRMSRTYHVDCQHSLTGANADVRLPLKPSRLRRVLEALAYEVGVTGVALPETLTDRESEFVKKAAKDLKENTGNSLVAVGAHLPPGLQVLGFRINEQLGNLGRALTFVEDPTVTGGSIQDLASRIDAGEIDAIVTLGGNPAYDAPADLDFAGKLASVPLSVHLSDYVDETARVSDIHVARAHFLEAWGDTRGWEGTVAPQQPLILPLFGGVSEIELLARIQDRPLTEGLALVLETFAGLMDRDLRPATDPDFRKFLHDGILADSTFAKVDVPSPTAAPLEDVVAEADGLEVVFCGSPALHDGRHANNGWLQELPDAMTKLTWDNAVLVNVKDAEKLGIRTNDLVTLTLAERSMVIAVYVMPGQPEGVIALPLGYGRRAGGSLAVTTAAEGGDGGGGFDTYQLRTTAGLDIASGCQLTPTGERYTLAMTQNHHLIDDTGYKGRIKRVGEHGKPGKIIRETTFDKHEKHVKAGKKGIHPAVKYKYGEISLQIFQPPMEYNYPHAWAMSVDMNACTGCSACVVACQAENNIPVVGKESVLNNREMHWLRVDRYFKAEGDTVADKKHDDDPDTVFQPLACVQCENAPCEQVCPVAATVHDTQGINVMIYNRCIGTRYCSNNCPYKVRRFNYLDYHYKRPRGSTLDSTYIGIPDQQQSEIDLVRRMVFNPDVTVRMRGVMEKCNYCQQRIQVATIHAKNTGETIKDGDVRTACQQVCPTDAIVFGNLNDATSRVTIEHQNPRTYGVLDELNVRPRTKYMAKLRNPPAKADKSEGDEHGNDHGGEEHADASTTAKPAPQEVAV